MGIMSWDIGAGFSSSLPEPVRTGPEPERVESEDDWKDAVKKALEKKKPPRVGPIRGMADDT